MKCIKCSCDNLMKDRTDGRCHRCRHPFVFDPRKTGELITDKLFENSVSLISVNQTLKFTSKQYYYFLNGMKAVQSKNTDGCLLLLLIPASLFTIIGLLMSPLNPGLMYFGIAMLIVVIIFLMEAQGTFESSPRKRIRITEQSSADFIQRWGAVNGSLEQLLAAPAKMLSTAEVAEELLDYSFDRLLVTETDSIANFLISNNFHFENNCAILSIKKFPSNLFPTIMKMLSNNKDLKVYALHNCSWRGISILQDLRNSSEWFKNRPEVQIIDIGLLPRQFEKKKMFVEHDSLSVPDLVSESWKKSLSAKELNWLNKGNIVHLESIPPQALIRMISRGIAMSKDPTKKSSLAPISGDAADERDFGDGGVWVYTSDSFG